MLVTIGLGIQSWGYLPLLPVVAGPKRYRIFGAIALLLSVYLIFGDIKSGKHHRQKMQQIRDSWSSTNAP
ncbi:MAG: hypothetical protein WDN00_10255 [Limisphaerales bacterium]